MRPLEGVQPELHERALATPNAASDMRCCCARQHFESADICRSRSGSGPMFVSSTLTWNSPTVRNDERTNAVASSEGSTRSGKLSRSCRRS